MPSPRITKLEATWLAKFVSSSHSLISQESLKHTQWLHILASAYGYRNWNALHAAIEDVPTLDPTDFFADAHRFALAELSLPGGEKRYLIRSHRGRAEQPFALAEQLADGVSRIHDFSGLTFRYTRPDPLSPLPPPELKRRPYVDLNTPVVASADRHGIRIVLWWVLLHYAKSFKDTSAREVAVDSVQFNHQPYGTQGAPTDRFLSRLTGVAHAPRRCYYVPREPFPAWLNESARFQPLILTEGQEDGEPADWDCGLDRMESVRQAYLRNTAAGLSRLDISDIAGRHRWVEPHPNDEPEFESYGMSED